MADAPEFRVYISSTIDDLIDERAAAKDVIKDYAVVKDSYRASESGSVETCTTDVRHVHLYVGLIGWRYGWVPDGAADPGARSITELEYDACVDSTTGRQIVKRLIFIRTRTDDKFNDLVTNPATAERVRKFRERARKEQQPYEFDSVSKLREALREAVRTKREEFHREKAPGQPIFDQRKVWKSALKPLVLLTLPGSDDDLRDLLVRRRPSLFADAEVSPGAPGLAVDVEKGVSKAQLACLLITPASLKRIAEPDAAARFARLIATLRRRNGAAAVVCVDVDPAALPPAWSPIVSVAISSESLRHPSGVAADAVYNDLRSAVLVTISTQPRIALPYLVIAPTRSEIQPLATDKAGAFDEFPDVPIRRQRRAQFSELRKAAAAVHPGWPRGLYGDRRGEWTCFGHGSSSVDDLIQTLVRSINTAHPGSRQREWLQDAELVVRPYDLDEYLADVDGSRGMIQDRCNRGCLLIVDETALLHSRLRAAAHVLLAARRTAVVSITPCDPAHWPSSRMLGEVSFLRVGSIVERFKVELDAQCELALNSEERVRRWLQHAIPRLILEMEGSASHPALVSRIDEHLG